MCMGICRVYALICCLTLSCAVSATTKSARDLKDAILKAHTNAFGNKESALTQRLTFDEKQFWLKTVSEIQEYVAAIVTVKGFLPSREKMAQQQAKKILMASMERLVRVNNDLLNSIASSYGIIALGLPDKKKSSGTRVLKEIDPKAINIKTLDTIISPLEAQKLVAIDVQKQMKNIPQIQNQQLKDGIELVDRLGLLLETTLQFTLNSFKKLSAYVISGSQARAH